MRYGRILDTRLAKLETVFVVPSPQDKTAALQTEALRMMSMEDLKSLREIFVLQNAGCTIEEMPERQAVWSRWNQVVGAVQAKTTGHAA